LFLPPEASELQGRNRPSWCQIPWSIIQSINPIETKQRIINNKSFLRETTAASAAFPPETAVAAA